MKRQILILIVLGLISCLGIVSADISGVAFNSPVAGANISGSSYLINWTNTGNIPGLNLQYKIGGCNSANSWQDLVISMGSAQTTYSWNTASLNGACCLRVYEFTNETLSGNFTVDNAAPIADFAGEPYACNEGSNITLNASASSDAETGISGYAWDLDNDGQYDDGTGVTITYSCGNGPSIKTVGVRVTDSAGNTDTEGSSVNISNVAPVCNGITAPTDAALTEPVTFWENATDVYDSLSYLWNFADTSGSTSNPAVHVYSTANSYNVTMTVSDGTATCMDSKVVTLVNPTVLTAQEVVALTNLVTNFGANNGAVANSFASGLTGGVICTKRITEPSAMTIAPNGNDCVVTWNNVNNSDSGVNPMIVRVSNATSYRYYSFNTIVYSWMINLTQGWNLVSIPVVPTNNTVQAVFLDQLYAVLPSEPVYSIWSYQYNEATAENEWMKTRRNGDGNLDLVSPGNAYWINMSSSHILKGYGDKLIAAQSPPSKTIVAGWNLIGHYGLLNVNLIDALRSISGHYNSILDENGAPIGANFNPGEGYWLSTQGLLNGQEMEYTPSNESYMFN